MERFLGNKANN